MSLTASPSRPVLARDCNMASDLGGGDANTNQRKRAGLQKKTAAPSATGCATAAPRSRPRTPGSGSARAGQDCSGITATIATRHGPHSAAAGGTLVHAGAQLRPGGCGERAGAGGVAGEHEGAACCCRARALTPQIARRLSGRPPPAPADPALQGGGQEGAGGCGLAHLGRSVPAGAARRAIRRAGPAPRHPPPAHGVRCSTCETWSARCPIGRASSWMWCFGCWNLRSTWSTRMQVGAVAAGGAAPAPACMPRRPRRAAPPSLEDGFLSAPAAATYNQAAPPPPKAEPSTSGRQPAFTDREWSAQCVCGRGGLPPPVLAAQGRCRLGRGHRRDHLHLLCAAAVGTAAVQQAVERLARLLQVDAGPGLLVKQLQVGGSARDGTASPRPHTPPGQSHLTGGV